MPCPNCDFTHDPETGAVYDATYPCPECGLGGAVVSSAKIAARYLLAKALFNVGDFVWIGKYKNKLAVITAFGADPKGNPTITVTPVPQGRKKPKTFSLFKVWKVQPEQIAELKAKGKLASMRRQSDESLWQGAVKALQDFQGAVKEIKSLDLTTPEGKEALDRYRFLPSPLDIMGRGKGFLNWTKIAFREEETAGLKEAPVVHGAKVTRVMDGDLDPDEYLLDIEILQDQLRSCLKKVGPVKFTYKGFTVVDDIRLGPAKTGKLLDAISFLIALFKKRGAEELFFAGVGSVYTEYENSWAGRYQNYSKSIEIDVSTLEREGQVKLWQDWAQEVFLHEFGHYIHMTYIKGEARAFWDGAWGGAKALRGKLERVGADELNQFYALLEKNAFDPARAVRQLRGVDKIKFTYWLRKSPMRDPLITPKQFRPTERGRDIFNALRDPEQYLKDTRDLSPGEPEYEATLKRVIRKKKEDLIGFGEKGFSVAPDIVAEISEADPSIKRELDAFYQDLGTPTDYGRTDEMEDFAESFVLFMTAPEKLSDKALYRVKRTLWLSGFGGKPVVKLARREEVEC